MAKLWDFVTYREDNGCLSKGHVIDFVKSTFGKRELVLIACNRLDDPLVDGIWIEQKQIVETTPYHSECLV